MIFCWFSRVKAAEEEANSAKSFLCIYLGALRNVRANSKDSGPVANQ